MSETMEKPKKKKQKLEVALTDSEGDEEEAKPGDEEAEFSADEDGDEKVVAQKNDSGEAYFDLNEKGTRRCTVRTFKGSVLVDIREVRRGVWYIYFCIPGIT